MLESIIIGAACTLLAPIVKGICDSGSDGETSDDNASSYESSVQCDGYYSESGSSGGERQTTLSEYGFGE